MSPNSATVSRRTVRALVAAGLACLISGLTVFFATLLPSASADHEDPQVVAGNPDCEDLGLESLDKIEFEEGDQPTIIDDITDLFDPEDYDLDIVAVIVKGGPSANVYDVPPFHDLMAPDGKEISHIEICGGEVVTTPPTSPPPTETPTETPTDKPTDEPTDKPTDEPTDEPTDKPTDEPTDKPTDKPTDEPTDKPTDEPTDKPTDELPKTGSGNGWLAALGAGLLLGGTGLVLAGRKAGRHLA